MNENSPAELFSRRNFLKTVGLTISSNSSLARWLNRISGDGGGSKGGSKGGRVELRQRSSESIREEFLAEGRVDMAEFMEGVGLDKVLAIDYPKLVEILPEMFDENEPGVFINRQGDRLIELDFSRLGGNEILLNRINTSVLCENVPKADSAKIIQSTAGLVFKGGFRLQGNILEPPILNGKFVKTGIHFIGNGLDQSEIVDIAFKEFPKKGLISEARPCLVAADNMNLIVNNLISITPLIEDNNNVIDYSLEQPLAGIMIKNSMSAESQLSCEVKNSRLNGLVWNAIVANGNAKIICRKMEAIQPAEYTWMGAGAVVITHGTGDSKIEASDCRINYCKGIWLILDKTLSADPVKKPYIYLSNVDLGIGAGTWGVWNFADTYCVAKDVVLKRSGLNVPIDKQISDGYYALINNEVNPDNRVDLGNLVIDFGNSNGISRVMSSSQSLMISDKMTIDSLVDKFWISSEPIEIKYAGKQMLLDKSLIKKMLDTVEREVGNGEFGYFSQIDINFDIDNQWLGIRLPNFGTNHWFDLKGELVK